MIACTGNYNSLVGKLKPWPKPAKRNGKVAPGCEHIAPDKNRALFALIAEIDVAAASATQNGESFVTFTFGRATFKVLNRFENLKRFRAKVLKNRRAFTDSAIQTAPQPQEREAMNDQTPAEVIAHCGTEIAAWIDPKGTLQAAGLLKVEKATASQTKPAKPRPWIPSWPEHIKTASALRKNAQLVIERKPPGYRWWLNRAVPIAKAMDRETLHIVKALLAQA